MVYQAGMDSVSHEYTRPRLEYSYAFRKPRDIPRAWITKSCMQGKPFGGIPLILTLINAPCIFYVITAGLYNLTQFLRSLKEYSLICTNYILTSFILYCSEISID